jgi:LCP family protein required for cell wall assembly
MHGNSSMPPNQPNRAPNPQSLHGNMPPQQLRGAPNPQSLHGNMPPQMLTHRVAGPPQRPNPQSLHGNMPPQPQQQIVLRNPQSLHGNNAPGMQNGPMNNNYGAPANHPVATMNPRHTGPLRGNNAIGTLNPPPGQGKPPTRVATRKHRRIPLWGKMILGACAVLLVLFGSGYWYYQQNYGSFVSQSTGQTEIHHHIIDSGGKSANALSASSDTLVGGRINVLLLGSDNDGKSGNNVTPLAQTDIIVTIDPQTHYVGMLSIPRDLQVTQPDTGAHYKLDEVFSHGALANGNMNDSIKSAAGLSIQTIEYNFGIHINYYAWVGLQGFVKVIDTAGGVDIDATHPMVDDNYPYDIGNKNKNANDYERLYIAPGPQHMNGTQALDYVRTRHSDLVGDFGRSARQQQVLSQLKTRLATPDIINKLPQLTSDLQGDVLTSIPINEMVQMANYARNVDTNKIDRITLSPPTYSTAATDGSTNFDPNCAAIEQKISQMFNLGNTANCIPQNGIPETISSVAPSNHTSNTAIASANTAPGTITNAVTGNSSTSASARTSALNNNLPANPVTTVHSMLDLMFAVTFDSPAGLQI